MGSSLTHAGAVAFRATKNGHFKFLIVSSSDGLSWVLPKGHIEAGETPKQAARRELLEEAGVTGEVLTSLSTAEYVKRGKPVIVRYYLVRTIETGAECEDREIRWLKLNDAMEQLTFDDAHHALELAAEELKRSGG